jgi:hypothetical protein
METDGNTAAVIGDRHRSVAVHRDVDRFRVAAVGLVRGVVDRFLDDVRGVRRAGIHPRQTLHRLYAAEFPD